MKFVSSILIFFLCSTLVSAQKSKLISKGNSSDSSFYAIARVSENDYWLCGEWGIVKRLDTLGNLRDMSIPTSGGHLLKLVKWKDFVFFSSDHGVLYRYDLIHHTWYSRSFEAFRNRCFYQFFVTDEGQLVLCGGTRGIAKGKKKVPHGFIATCDTGFSNLKILRKRFSQFVFMVKPLSNGEVMAVAFNGIFSSLYESRNLHSWKRRATVRGLVHDFLENKDTLLLCGSRNMKYKDHGLMGFCRPDVRRAIFPGTGCIWRMIALDKNIFAVSRSGGFACISGQKQQWNPFFIPEVFSIYAIEFMSSSKCIIAGHGKRIYTIEFEKPFQ